MKKEGVPFWPNAAWRDMLFGMLVILAILILAIAVGPPEVGAPPDPTNIHTNLRPDWYLLWIFAMFALMPRAIESYAIVLLPVIGGLILVLLPVIFNTGERSPARRPWSVGIVLALVTVIGVFWHLGVKAPWPPRFNAVPLSKEIIGHVSASAEHGALLFHDKTCITCHTISGQGGIHGPNLTDAGDRLNRDQITLKIVNGGKNMPDFGGILTKDELNDLVDFLETRTESK